MSKRRPSELEAKFALQLRSLCADLPEPVREYMFWPGRRFRFDFAWVEHKVAAEVEGFGHHKLNRYRTDIGKYNEASVRGWILIRITSPMLNDLSWQPLLRRALQRGEP